MGVGPIGDVEVGYIEAAAFDTCMLENFGGGGINSLGGAAEPAFPPDQVCI